MNIHMRMIIVCLLPLIITTVICPLASGDERRAHRATQSCAPDAAAADRSQTTEKDRKRIQELLTKAWSRRKQIRSGVFEAVEYRSNRTNIYCAFDHDKRLFRFDRSGWDESAAKVDFRYIRVAEKQMVRDRDGRTFIFGTKWKPYQRRFDPFDVRLLGVHTWAGQHRLGMEFDRVQKFYANEESWSQVTVGPDKRLRIDFKYKNESSTWGQSLWFNESEGLTPVRLEVHFFGRNRKQDRPIEMVQTSWKKFKEVWVPMTVHAERRTTTGNRDFDLKITWKSVNDPVDANLFKEQALKR